MSRGMKSGDPRCREHADHEHLCPNCARKIMGNAYFYHRKACVGGCELARQVRHVAQINRRAGLANAAAILEQIAKAVTKLSGAKP